MNIVDINPNINISIITVNVNGLNVSIKRQRLSERIKKKTKIQLYVVYNKPTLNIKIDWILHPSLPSLLHTHVHTCIHTCVDIRYICTHSLHIHAHAHTYTWRVY